MNPAPPTDQRDLCAWYFVDLLLQTSKIHGQGVFSTHRINANQPIMRLGGFLLPSTKRYTTEVIPSTSIGVSEDVILGEISQSEKDISDYLNHSCMPNAGFLDAVTIIASCDIEAGEEVTLDYAYWEANDQWVLKNPCACGTSSCRTVVSGKDWRRAEITHRMLQWASPFVRRRIYSLHKI